MYQRLQQCASVPDFNNYLAFILTRGEGAPEEVRQTAGLLLKNNLKSGWGAASRENKVFIQNALLQSLGHPVRFLRHTVGTCVSMIARAAGPTGWPEMYLALADAIAAETASANPNLTDGGLDAVYKVCEELNGRLDVPVPNMPEGSPAGLLLPKLLALVSGATGAGAAETAARRGGLGAINLMTPSWPQSHAHLMDAYLRGLFALALDTDGGVRKEVCSGIVSLLYRAPEKLAPNMREVIAYMIERTSDGDEDVALESCEFWAAFCEADLERDTVEVLREFTPKLIPMLLTNMKYAEDDEEVIAAEEDEANAGREDRDQDVRPSFKGQRDRGDGASGGVSGSAADDGDETYYDAGEDDDDDAQWNLRKSSANGLDVMSNVFGDELLGMILPIVEQRFRESDWRLRESAILAVGAVSEGCDAGLTPFLPQLIEFLVPSLEDPRPMLRATACWTLSRFARYTAQLAFAARPGDPPPATAAQGRAFVERILGGLLRRVGDKNKHVQAAACGALATLLGECREDIAPWLSPTASTLGQAIASYGRKNLRCALDAAATLADSGGDALKDPAVARALLGPLLQKWESGGDNQADLYQLLECVTSVTMGVGLGAQEFAAPMFSRALALARRALVARDAQDSAYEPDHVVCALDLLSGICDGVGAGAASLVASDPDGVREAIAKAVTDAESPGVRRSAFALVGDVAKAPGAAAHLAPMLAHIVDAAAANLEPAMVQAWNMGACNNACWSAGEMAMAFPPETLAPHAPRLAAAFCRVLSQTMVHRSLGENAAIALGRFALRCPDHIKQGFAELVTPWCGALRRLRDGVEKEHAFAGLVALARAAPEGGVGGLAPMMHAIASWQRVRDAELHANLLAVMRHYEALLGPERWAELANALGPATIKKLGAFATNVG
jgi:transportin-1